MQCNHKIALMHMRSEKSQIRLREYIRAVWSGPSLPAFWIIWYCRMNLCIANPITIRFDDFACVEGTFSTGVNQSWNDNDTDLYVLPCQFCTLLQNKLMSRISDNCFLYVAILVTLHYRYFANSVDPDESDFILFLYFWALFVFLFTWWSVRLCLKRTSNVRE